jgi:methionyl-tRNA formyltransferase
MDYFPIPGAFFVYKDERYKVLKAEIVKKSREYRRSFNKRFWKLAVEIINL